MLWLVGFFILFIIVLLIITVLVFRKPKPKVSTVESKTVLSIDDTLESLTEVLKTETKDISKIKETLEKMLVGFPFPENEKEANGHLKYVYFYAKNPLANAKMIVEMQKRLTQKNPSYAKHIEDFQMRGVEARKSKK